VKCQNAHKSDSVLDALPGTDALVQRVLDELHLGDQVGVLLELGGHAPARQDYLYVLRPALQGLDELRGRYQLEPDGVHGLVEDDEVVFAGPD
jgi:hypothetical protein